MEPLFYAVLVRLSPGYSPLIGRLHTRYSPVRRSPPMYCYIVLPLDLHVLGLSLAFILSQDQTLRCIISFFYNSIENFAFSPSKGAARDSPVLTLTFFTRLVLLCLSFSQRSFALSSPLLSQCVSVIPEKRVQR